jgi:flagellar protein FliL
MVDEKEGTMETAENSGQKKSMMKWIVIGVAIVFIGAGGYVGWNVYARMTVMPNEAPSDNSKMKTEKPVVIFPLRSFIVNLMDRSGIGKKYLKVTMEIEVGNEEKKKLVENHIPQLSDMILLLLSSQSTEEINTLEGKLELKHALLTRMNQVIGSPVIHKVYFTEFVVQ